MCNMNVDECMCVCECEVKKRNEKNVPGQTFERGGRYHDTIGL